jgi:hypothetical protein
LHQAKALGLGARQPGYPARAAGTATAILIEASDVTRYKRTEQLVRAIVSRIDAVPVSARSTEVAPMRPTSDDTATMLRTCFPDLTQRESEVLGEAISGGGLPRNREHAWNSADHRAQLSSAHSHQARGAFAAAGCTKSGSRVGGTRNRYSGEFPGRYAALELILGLRPQPSG